MVVVLRNDLFGSSAIREVAEFESDSIVADLARRSDLDRNLNIGMKVFASPHVGSPVFERGARRKVTNSDLTADSLVIAAAMLPADPGRIRRTSRQLLAQCRHEAGVNVAHDYRLCPLAHERNFVAGRRLRNIPELRLVSPVVEERLGLAARHHDVAAWG